MNRQSRLIAPWIYVLAVVAASGCIATLAWAGEIQSKDLAIALLALLSTFFGAQFAFRLGERRDSEREVQRRIAAINRSLLVLGAQQNEIRTMKKELDQFKNDVDCALGMNAFVPPDTIGLSQKIDDLDFLIDSPDPNLIFKIHVEQLRFDQALVAARLRAKHCLDELQPAFAASTLIRGGRYSYEDLKANLGEQVFESAANLITTMRHHINQSDDSIPALQREIREMGRLLFPKATLIKFDLLDVNPQSDSR
ncbi:MULTISPECIES: hypothetical protein [Xanthomonas]|uniref:Uncharacterized protein n=1 Tax=Xanthomonas hortorum pv. vitians TaxID=83224 RepID=A0A6V7F9Z2_9XANT|nr:MULTISPECIES: hypothetical protein [Xanthomonas]MCE4301574.1 hypothetical protein [Xanthomonas hortorum pv. vitians]MCE4552457.1 hypothetical protein [Xanthomonas hortorum pv. vitians]MDT7822569.1 hypothetical protein [Xanthomonas hortorum pv. vitians]MDV7248036.1 hypothetical protein [Xanthomonas hortorum pv. vitians]NMI29029.1 hypothetical protein [Xanthomonas hortorum pv. vitians]